MSLVELNPIDSEVSQPRHLCTSLGFSYISIPRIVSKCTGFWDVRSWFHRMVRKHSKKFNIRHIRLGNGFIRKWVLYRTLPWRPNVRTDTWNTHWPVILVVRTWALWAFNRYVMALTIGTASLVIVRPPGTLLLRLLCIRTPHQPFASFSLYQASSTIQSEGRRSKYDHLS